MTEVGVQNDIMESGHWQSYTRPVMLGMPQNISTHENHAAAGFPHYDALQA